MEQSKAGAQIGRRAFIQAAVILLALMILAGVLTRVIMPGTYSRSLVDGREVIDPASFHYTAQPPLPVWRWFTAPVEVLWGPDAVMVITIIVFIMLVGGSFAVLDRSQVLRSVIARAVAAFKRRKYLLLAIIVLFFMALGGFLGIFEETVPLIPMVLALAYSLGWDSLTGLGMSLLATGFGFAAAVSNPFTVGVAQRLAGLPLFSGAAFRVVIFAAVYLIVLAFLTRHARRVERDPRSSPVYAEDQAQRAKYGLVEVADAAVTPALRRAGAWLGLSLLAILVVFTLSPFIATLSSLSLPLTGLLFLAAGVGSGLFAGFGGRGVWRAFLEGIGGIAPGIILILMAMSVKFIIVAGGIMDTTLHGASLYISRTTPVVAAALVYLLTLVLEFFVNSGSAKAFLVVPIIAPLADLVGLTRQTAVLGYCFGDGFTNLFYPTNAVLLIGLGLTVVTYPKWIRWTIGLQVVVFLVTLGFLALAAVTRFGPF
ncbi:MAG TPA: hypothetical protein VGL40_05785 [Bacillota bacterium]